MINPALRSKFAGAMIGTGIGDALGAPFEGKENPAIQEIKDLAKKRTILKYTDDTHMMIGVAESLIRSRGFNAEDMFKRLMDNYFAEPDRGYGAGPPYIFKRVKRGAKWQVVTREIFHGGSYGNGAAMRIAPVGLLFNNNLSQLRSVAFRSAELTHAHSLGKEGAALQAYAVALAAGLTYKSFSRSKFLYDLRNYSQSEVYISKIDIIDKYSKEMDKDSIELELGNGIEAYNSVPTAIHSFVSFPDSFEDAVLNAISLGGDADTIGAMTGAISGAYLGIEGIPEEWIRKLENRGYIETLVEQLLATKTIISPEGNH